MRLWGERVGLINIIFSTSRTRYSWFSVFVTAKNSFQKLMRSKTRWKLQYWSFLYIFWKCLTYLYHHDRFQYNNSSPLPPRNTPMNTKNLGKIMGLNITNVQERWIGICIFLEFVKVCFFSRTCKSSFDEQLLPFINFHIIFQISHTIFS